MARELAEHAEAFHRVTGFDHPMLRRQLGLAYNLLGMHEPAIQHLGEAVRYVKEPKDLEVVRALAGSLVATGRLDQARRLLTMPVRDKQLREACQRLLAEFELQDP